jgi:hypothetical protein
MRLRVVVISGDAYVKRGRVSEFTAGNGVFATAALFLLIIFATKRSATHSVAFVRLRVTKNIPVSAQHRVRELRRTALFFVGIHCDVTFGLSPPSFLASGRLSYCAMSTALRSEARVPSHADPAHLRRRHVYLPAARDRVTSDPSSERSVRLSSGPRHRHLVRTRPPIADSADRSVAHGDAAAAAAAALAPAADDDSDVVQRSITSHTHKLIRFSASARWRRQRRVRRRCRRMSRVRSRMKRASKEKALLRTMASLCDVGD